MKPKTTLKLMRAERLAAAHFGIPRIETVDQREEVYRLLDEAGWYWSSRQEWVKRKAGGRYDSDN